MSTTMDQIHRIREMYYQQDKNISEIASETGFNWKTVKKYVDMEDFNAPPPKPASEDSHESKLDVFKPLIDSWLKADKLAPRKQRHTAKRVFRRLQKEAKGFDCSYRLVAMYVSLNMTDAAAQKFNVLEDKKCQNFIGTISCSDNLKLIKKPENVFTGKLTEQDKAYLFDGLQGILPQVFMDRIWDMIYERYKIYEKL